MLLLGEGSALRGPGQRDTDLHDSTQLRHLRMLKELRADQVGTDSDSHKARPKRSRAMYSGGTLTWSWILHGFLTWCENQQES